MFSPHRQLLCRDGFTFESVLFDDFATIDPDRVIMV